MFEFFLCVLIVEPPPVWPKYVWSVLVLLVVLAVVVGSVFYCKYKKAKCNAGMSLCEY